jgi:hypothetical protein
MAKKKFLFSWTGFAAKKLVSAVVTNGSKQNIVMTFRSIKPFKNCVYTEFSASPATAPTKAVDSRTLSYPNKTVTVHVTAGFVFGDTITCTYNPPGKGATVIIPVTNLVEQA